MANTKTYSLKIDATVETCTLQLQKFSTASLTVDGSAVTSVSGKGGDTISFTVGNGQYINAFVSTTYAKNSFDNTNSQCNVCFILAEKSSFIWQVTGKTAQGDNPTIFKPSTMKNTTEHDTAVLEVVMPTAANPSTPPSSAQVLDATQVYVVDYDAEKRNLLVRGNSPLGKETEGNQLINFTDLENAILGACEAASIDPLMNSYVLHDISLLSDAEEYIWANEYYSFGNAGAPSMETQTWFPAASTMIPALADENKKGQWSRWNIEPDLIGQTLADLTKELKTAMASDADSTTLDIYYVHCASGHDRTGMVSATYIGDVYDASISLDEAFVMGTTLQKQLTGGGDIVADCNDWETTTASSLKSRCFMADAAYNNTFLKAMGILQPTHAPYTLDQDAGRTPENSPIPYVLNGYPFPVAL